ncbi:MAG: 50S ribosomal protein P1 [Candidatus Micrarchaeota archaeon]|nr:50S ribosomal protein P1 [Candidatus Micrarchaeota archaeon]
MEYTYAAMLLHATKQPINEENVKKVLHSTGAKVDDLKVKALVTALDGVNIEEAIAKAAVVAAPASAAPAGAAKEAPKDEKSEEKKEEEAAAGLASLFG